MPCGFWRGMGQDSWRLAKTACGGATSASRADRPSACWSRLRRNSFTSTGCGSIGVKLLLQPKRVLRQLNRHRRPDRIEHSGSVRWRRSALKNDRRSSPSIGQRVVRLAREGEAQGERFFEGSHNAMVANHRVSGTNEAKARESNMMPTEHGNDRGAVWTSSRRNDPGHPRQLSLHWGGRFAAGCGF